MANGVAGVQIVNRVRTEELRTGPSPCWPMAVSRSRYLAPSVLLAFAAPALFILIAGVVIGAPGCRCAHRPQLRLPRCRPSYHHSRGLDGGRPHAVAGDRRPSPGPNRLVGRRSRVVRADPAWAEFQTPGWALGISPYYHVPRRGRNAGSARAAVDQPVHPRIPWSSGSRVPSPGRPPTAASEHLYPMAGRPRG